MTSFDHFDMSLEEIIPDEAVRQAYACWPSRPPR